MQTFGYNTTEDDELSKDDVPMATKKFLRYTNGIEAYLQAFPSFSPDHWAVFSWRNFVCFFVIIYFYLIPIFMFFGYEVYVFYTSDNNRESHNREDSRLFVYNDLLPFN